MTKILRGDSFDYYIHIHTYSTCIYHLTQICLFHMQPVKPFEQTKHPFRSRESMGCHEFSSQSLANLSKGGDFWAAIFGAKKDETWVVYRLTVDYKIALGYIFSGLFYNLVYGSPYEFYRNPL